VRHWASSTAPAAVSAASAGAGSGSGSSSTTLANSADSDGSGRYTPPAYSHLGRTHSPAALTRNWADSQESFFFAETLKYMYLLHSAVDDVPTDRFVFNTEAHPVGVVRLRRTVSLGSGTAKPRQSAGPTASTNASVRGQRKETAVGLPQAWLDAIDAARAAASSDGAGADLGAGDGEEAHGVAALSEAELERVKRRRQKEIRAKLHGLAKGGIRGEPAGAQGGKTGTDAVLSFGRDDLLRLLWAEGEDERARVFWHKVLAEAANKKN